MTPLLIRVTEDPRTRPGLADKVPAFLSIPSMVTPERSCCPASDQYENASAASVSKPANWLNSVAGPKPTSCSRLPVPLAVIDPEIEYETPSFRTLLPAPKSMAVAAVIAPSSTMVPPAPRRMPLLLPLMSP